DRLRLLLDFSQRMRSAGGLEEILSAMIDAALRLTGAERGFVFLRPTEPGKPLRLATGRTASAENIHDDSGISHSIVARADQAGEAVILNDTRQVKADLARSVVEQDLRTVVAIPLRDARDAEAAGVGVLYLDSHAASPTLGKISREMLDVLANDATQVVLNAELALRQEQSRQMEKELVLAASIQQGLMATHLPTFDYCRLDGLSQACHQIGGDFFDAVQIAGDSGAVAIVLADVSGKGAAAALLAASLQGIVHSHLRAGSRLADIASMANQFICQRLEGEKYATMIIVRLDPSGEFEYLNCGHIPPVVTGPGGCRTLDAGNMPVGLVPTAEYASARHQLAPGERLLLVSDGVTEAANTEREMFGDQRLTDCMGHDFNVRALADEVHRFCQGAPLTDDLTLLEVRYR
ncbi:MAG: PP2C family protein-serine/threonine phosphatase, partial [Terriglobales bacterium]